MLDVLLLFEIRSRLTSGGNLDVVHDIVKFVPSFIPAMLSSQGCKGLGHWKALHTLVHEYCLVPATQSEATSILDPLHDPANENKIHLSVKERKHL